MSIVDGGTPGSTTISTSVSSAGGLTQIALRQDIGWTQGDPVALAATVIGAGGWAGPHVVVSPNAMIATLAATVEQDGPNATLTLTLPVEASAQVPCGEYDWQLRAVAGPTRMAGKVTVSLAGDDGAAGVTTSITAADVFIWLKTDNPTDKALSLMQIVVDAVLAHASRFYEAPVLEPDADWRLGLTMQSARIWGRKDSPGGVLSSDDLGVIRVSRFDSDIEKLLAPFKIWAIA